MRVRRECGRRVPAANPCARRAARPPPPRSRRLRLLRQGPGDTQLVRVPRALGLVPGRRDRVQPGSHGAYKIKINFLSTSSDQQRVSLVRRLAASDSSIDILAMDVDWTAEFATAKWIRPVPAASPPRSKPRISPGRFRPPPGERLWAVPINSNTELLWYRKDLVPNPPTTWTQMIPDADQLAEEGKPHYIEEQGAQYEGLTVWFNSLVNSAGGQSLPDNQVVIGRPAGMRPRSCTARHLAGRRPVAERHAGGSGTRRSKRQGRVRDQLPVRLVGDPGGQPRSSRTWVRPFPEVAPGIPAGLDRWLQPRHLGLLQAPGPRLRGGQCLTQHKNQSRDAIKGGLAPVAASIYDQPSFEKAYPFHS